MMRSGIAPLDLQPGTLLPGRLHLLTGGPGTGKTTACLHFLNAGLSAGESVAMLTLDRVDDLVSHARSIGLDLAESLRSDRLLLLRYQENFGVHLSSGGPADRVLSELGRLLNEVRPARLVIDPFTPFLQEDSSSGAAVSALALWLVRGGTTSILTYNDDVSRAYQARLDPIVLRAAAIIHSSRGPGDIRSLQIVQNRAGVAPSTPLGFTIRPGIGVVALEPQPARIDHPPISPNGHHPALLDREQLARIVAARASADRPAQYALVTFSCTHRSTETLHEIARIALRTMRAAQGDLVAVLEDRVAVYLHGARLRDAGPFIVRVRAQWARKHRIALQVESLSHPADMSRLRSLLEVAQPT